MFFKNWNIAKTHYLLYNCEFQEEGSNLLLVATKNPTFRPFVGMSFSRSSWDLISTADITCGAKHDVAYGYLLNHLEKGNTIFNEFDSNLLLKKDEFIKFQSYHSVYLNESRSVRVSNSRHSGRSVRHAGASYGIGSSVSVSESFDEIKTIDVGQITITNKRFIFSGEKKSVDVDVKKITSITPYSDGIKLQRKNKQKVEYFTNLNHYLFTREIGGEIYFFILDGFMIKALIESSLDNLRYISDLQLFDAQSIPKLKKASDDNLISFRYDDINLEYPSSWKKIEDSNNRIFTIESNVDGFRVEINISKENLFENVELFKQMLLNSFRNQQVSTFGFKDIKINGIDMFTISSLTYKDGILFESIFTYFNNEKNGFSVFLLHPFKSDAKNDYFQLINSITIDSIVVKIEEFNANFCYNCGTKLEPDSKFCINCGIKLD